MMKRIVLTSLILGLLVLIVWLFFSLQSKREETLLAEVRTEYIPNLSLNTLAGGVFSLLELSTGTATVLIYFNSTCEICQMELKSIEKRISDFDSAQILLVSSQEKEEFSEFHSSHPLKDAANVYWFLDGELEVAGHYRVRSVPAIFCYDAQGKLQGRFQGPIKVDLILKSLGIEKPAES